MARSRAKVAPPDEEPSSTATISAPLDVRSTAITLVAVIAVAAALHVARDVCVPLVLGILASYALEPIVAWCTRRWIPRTVAAAAVMLVLGGAVGATAWALADDTVALVGRVPEATRRVRDALRGGPPDAIEDVNRLATEIERGAQAAASAPAPPPPGVTRVQIEEKPLDVRAAIVTGSIGAVGLAGQALLVGFLVFFLLACGDLFKRKLARLAGPSLSRKRVTVQALDEIAHQVQQFLLVNLTTSVIVAVASWLAFRALGLENAGVWGVVAGVLNTAPYVGPLVVMVGVALVAFLQFGTVGMVAATAGASFAVTTLEGLFLTPWLAGRAARMNPVAVFVGFMFWGWLWGIPGMLLAVPMMAVIKVVCDHVDDLKPLGELLGD
jgi:predicted PurR-regulated permease PerM